MNFATATLATHEQKNEPTVASVASVAVANPTEDKSGMTGEAHAKVNRWLDHIGAVDPVERQEVVDNCTSDPSALEYFLRRHAEDCAPDLDDSRRTSRIIDAPKGWKPEPCNRCANLSRFAGGNACRVDNGLPVIFGLLYVPDGAGVDCEQFKGLL